MIDFKTRDEIVEEFSRRLDQRIGQIRRVARQRMSLDLTDQHALDVLHWVTSRSSARYALLLGNDAGDEDVAAMLEQVRRDVPGILHDPTRDEYVDRLVERGERDPFAFAARRTPDQRRREFFLYL